MDPRLNAPYGARCFLTEYLEDRKRHARVCLNAPYGARCFLTQIKQVGTKEFTSLNAPYGARCFLTGRCLQVSVCAPNES